MKLTVQDRVDIGELVARLCQALDFSHPQDFVDVFVSTGVYQATSSIATGQTIRFRHEGADQLRAFAEAAVIKRQGLGRHWTGNLVIEPTEDGAKAVSYVMFLQVDPISGARTIPISGVHQDVFARTPDGWRLAQRTIVADL